jgi:hypothetical protein
VIQEDACTVHRHREGVPIEVHHVWPKGMGGPNVAANRVKLCSNGHGEVHEYLALLVAGDGRVPWRTKLRYGFKVRRVAQLGYDRIKRGAL